MTEWTTVRAIARYPEGATTPAAITAGLSTADQATADAAATARRSAGFPGPLTVYLLDRTAVLGVGTVDLGTNSDGKHLGLRQGKLLRAEHHQSKIRVGGGSSWLTLPGSGAPHQDFAPPLIDVAFP
ncbi:hypothetical protein [Gordonia sp. (in: high G+C Gram-positive bacteria)]|uniref:hypothetical protein n=1 Tax=Gordonia sp. (in: high G+C Gram-positive bacteria) TaxID=84139 RepID=UPI003F944697